MIVGVRPDGTKELVPVADGYRDSTDSWADVLRNLRDRGLKAPTLAVGDGALGSWAARETSSMGKSESNGVECIKTANVLDALPKRLHRDGKKAINAIYNSETRSDTLVSWG